MDRRSFSRASQALELGYLKVNFKFTHDMDICMQLQRHFWRWSEIDACELEMRPFSMKYGA